MSKYAHRFCKKAVTCPECFERLQEKFGNNFGLTPYSLICEFCGGSGYLLVKEYKSIYGVSPAKNGLVTFNVEV